MLLLMKDKAVEDWKKKRGKAEWSQLVSLALTAITYEANVAKLLESEGDKEGAIGGLKSAAELLDEVQIRLIKQAFKLEFPGLSVGLGDGCLEIRKKGEEEIPSVYCGIPVNVIKIGDMKARKVLPV